MSVLSNTEMHISRKQAAEISHCLNLLAEIEAAYCRDHGVVWIGTDATGCDSFRIGFGRVSGKWPESHYASRSSQRWSDGDDPVLCEVTRIFSEHVTIAVQAARRAIAERAGIEL